MTARQFKPIYVLHGDDEYLRDEQRRRIFQEVLAGADPQLAVTSHDGKRRGGPPTGEQDGRDGGGPPTGGDDRDSESPADRRPSVLPAEVLDDLMTPPLLAPTRLVIVRDADDFVSAYRQALESYLQKPSPTAALLLMVNSWPSSTNLHKQVARIGEAVDCSAPAGTRLAQWLAEAAGKRGKKIDPDAARLLEECVGADLSLLDAEVEKLSLYAGSRPAIAAADVRLLTLATAEPVDFALSNALRAGDAKAALTVLDKTLTRRGLEFKALGEIGWHLRTAIAAQTLRQSGQDPGRALRVPYDVRQAYMALLQRRSLAKLQANFRRVLAAALAMKSGSASRAVMQDLVMALCA